MGIYNKGLKIFPRCKKRGHEKFYQGTGQKVQLGGPAKYV